MVQMVKNPPTNAGDLGSIPGLGRFLEEGMATYSSILAWRIPWTKEPSRRAWPGGHGGHKESDTTEKPSTQHIHR